MGPALAPKACYRWSYIDPVLAPWNATYGFTWAQCWPESMLRMILHGPSPGHPECYEWSCMGQHWPQSMQPMVLHGPALATKHATNGLAWAQCRPKSMLRMFLHGPSAGPSACY